MVELPVKMYIDKLAKRARNAVRPLATLTSPVKTSALLAMAEVLEEQVDRILEANQVDVEAIGKSFAADVSRDRVREAVDRVTIKSENIEEMVTHLRQLAQSPDPVGETSKIWTQPNGMQVSKVRVPIGVIAIICDYGPTVLLKSLSLCLKSGNVSILRANPEWKETNSVLFELLQETAVANGLPKDAFIFIERIERDAALELIKLPKLIDVVIPRGGLKLRKVVVEQAKMPVLCHEGGISFVYVDGDCDFSLAQNIVVNSKAQCADASNAVDTLLIHKGTARSILPGLVRRLLDEYKIEIRGCIKTMSLTGTPDFPQYKSTKPAQEADWDQQWGGPTMTIKIVESMEDAFDHIVAHGPAHTATIVTRDYATAMQFVRAVDASAVTVNASTRLHDGPELGVGEHMGISTMRIHARGPIGLEELTCEKYVILGNGQLRHPHPIPDEYEDAIMLKRH